MSNELVKTSVNMTLGKIELENKKQLKEMIESALKKYKNVVVSLETEKEAKAQRAELNKIKTALSDFRIEKKKAYLQPLDDFENDIKEITSKLDEVIGSIGTGLKELDEAQRAERAKRVDELVEEYGKGFEIVCKPSWLNKTAKETQTIDDIKFQVIEFEVLAKQRVQEIETVRQTCEINELEPSGYISLLESGASNVMEVVKIINEAAKDKRDREAREKEIEAYNAERERIRATEEIQEPLPEPKKEEVIDEAKTFDTAPFETGEVLTSVLELKGTLTQFTALNEALVNAGVQIRELSTIEDYTAKLNELKAYAR